MGETVKEFLKINTTRLISTGVVIFVTILLLTAVRIFTNKLVKKGKNKRSITVSKLVNSVLKYVIAIILLISLLGIWGYDISTLLAGAGIMGLIIGLGAQNLVSDLLSGMSIVFEDVYEVDEVVNINGFKGRVVDIGIRSTKLLNWKGELKIITNGEIKEVINYSRNFAISEVVFSIKHKENVSKTIALLDEKLPNIKEFFSQIIEGPNVLGVSNITSIGTEITVIAKTLPEKHISVTMALRKMIKEILDEKGIEFSITQVELINER